MSASDERKREAELSPLTPEECAEIGSELEMNKGADDLKTFYLRNIGENCPLRCALASFALELSAAKRLRLVGNIREAWNFERNAQRIYEALPDDARW